MRMIQRVKLYAVWITINLVAYDCEIIWKNSVNL